MKLIVLILGLAIGFGVGIWWGVHHPTEAASLSAQEEAEFIKTAQATKDKLDAMVAKQQAASGGSSIPVPGSSFAGGSASPASHVDPDLQNLSQQMQSQLDALKAKAHK